MGLLQVSARGGIWLGARAGVARFTDQSGGGDSPPSIATGMDGPQGTGIRRAPRGSGVIYDFTFGSYFLLGSGGLRFEYEVDGFVLDNAVMGEAGGMRLRLGLGAYF